MKIEELLVFSAVPLDVLCGWAWRSVLLLPSVTCLLLPISLHTCNPYTNQAAAVYMPWFFTQVFVRLLPLPVCHHCYSQSCEWFSCVYLCLKFIFSLRSLPVFASLPSSPLQRWLGLQLHVKLPFGKLLNPKLLPAPFSLVC